MNVPTTLQDVPVTMAILSGLSLYGAFVIGIVLYLVRVRDQLRDEAREHARAATAMAEKVRDDARAEAETARRLAREAREMTAALETKIAREYVSHEQLGRLGDEIKTELRDLRNSLMTAIAAAGQPRRARDP
ncbi:hypothetical protein ACTZWW_04015 [Salinarimonas sp. NSM]|uniref:hypothetical protein n=1 Tax=Salinarimonas sp. NSM TaxID=3458003 RepID=UPI004036AEC3